MILPERMSRVSILGPKTVMEAVIDEFYALKLLHLYPHQKTADVDIGTPLAQYDEVAELIVKIRTLAANLGISRTGAKRLEGGLESVSERIEKILSEANVSVKKKHELEKLDQYYSKVKQVLAKGESGEGLKELDIDFFDTSVDFSDLIGFFGFVDQDVSYEVKEEVPTAQAFSSDFEGLRLIALFVEKKEVPKAIRILTDHHLVAIDQETIKTSLRALKGEIADVPPGVGKEAEEVKTQLTEYEGKISTLADEHCQFIGEAWTRLEEENQKAEAPLRFGTTERTFMINGWVPSKQMAELRKRLDKVSNGEILVEENPVGPKEAAPVKQNIPKWARPFKHFIDMFATPVYGEFDPTILIALTFPIFFGFMLGDIAYGFIVTVLFVWAGFAMKWKPILGVMPPWALIYAGLCTLGFGFMYGEFFGAEVGLYHPFFPRYFLSESHGHELLHIWGRNGLEFLGVNSGALLTVSLLIALIHISIGLFTGFYNVYRLHGLKHAIFEKLGWILLMPSLAWVLSDLKSSPDAILPLGLIGGTIDLAHKHIHVPISDHMAAIIPDVSVLSVLAIIGVLLLLKGEGAMAIMEILSLFSNLVSYARLMAVGLASLLLAIVANNMAVGMFAGGSVLGIIGGIFVLVIFHLINVALAILSPFLHSIRLHYVEYFTKFYHGGGRAYDPFGFEDRD